MAKYRVIAASVNIHAGVLGLEPHQARARLHRLKPLGGNCYEVIDPPVTFKRGEVFEYEGELPKSLVEAVASCPVGAALVAARQGQPQGLPLQNPISPFPAIEPDLVTDLVEGVPDDGVPEPPAGGKKRPRRKPAA